jgi:hypothetical protein
MMVSMLEFVSVEGWALVFMKLNAVGAWSVPKAQAPVPVSLFQVPAK